MKHRMYMNVCVCVYAGSHTACIAAAGLLSVVSEAANGPRLALGPQAKAS